MDVSIIRRTLLAVGALVGVCALAGCGGAPPPAHLAAGLRAGPVVAGAERRQLLAAFNGGFKLAAAASGYMQEGHVLSPLRAGLASHGARVAWSARDP